MDKNCSIHAKTPTYHVTLLNANMHVRAHTRMYPCMYTHRQNAGKSTWLSTAQQKYSRTSKECFLKPQLTS